MTQPTPIPIRKLLVEAYERGGHTYKSVGELFGVGEATVSRILGRARGTGDLAPDPHGGGNPARIPAEQHDALRALVTDLADATLRELCDAWHQLHGVELSAASMGRALKAAGMSRKKSNSVRRNKNARM
jgi:transposase